MRNNKARSFVVIMIAVALTALGLRIAILQFVNISISSNEAAAVETLKLISTAIENYARDHAGVFPSSLAALADSSPAYIGQEYASLVYEKGYNFNCLRLEPSGYTCSASPMRCNWSGKKNFTVTTGQAMTSEDCAKKE